MQGVTNIKQFSAMLYEARKRKFPSRLAAEEYLPVCARMLDDYENGKRIPMPDTVAAISDALEEPLLDYIYCAICPIGRKRNRVMDKPEDLARVALQLVKELQDVVSRQQDFINIVHDGEVHEHEREKYLEFLKELRELKHAVEILELWTEAELDTKKEPLAAAK